MKTFSTKRKAFTLIELLIVIAIIGILFIVLVSKVDFATDKAKATGVQTDFRSFQLAFEQVAKENSGFNTFGWDTGDTKRTDFDTALAGYTYTNEANDKGDKVRNSYDEGDKNLNGVCDTGETFTGRKIYTETWTGVYTLVKPGTTTYDSDAIFALETAINKNLDPKLHITIATDGIITMANGAQDPWKNEYHGRYQSNAAVDNLDRGVIIIYSDGANGENGSADGITGGLINITTPGSNVDGKDDYALATVYTYANGYSEVKSITYGFSNNQSFGDASDVPVTPVGQTPTIPTPNPGEPVTPPAGGGTGSLPTPDVEDAVANSPSPIAYSWSELKTLANANLSEAELRDTYGIEVGDYKEVSGVKYVLVDRGDAYGGFVFMYNAGTTKTMNSTNINKGGYVSTNVMKPYVDGLYDGLATDLKSAIKKVTITCNSGDLAADGTDTNGTSTYTTDAYLFLASSKEVGFNLSGYQYAAEGTCFDLFTTDASSRTGFMSTANISSTWWLRSAYSDSAGSFYLVATVGDDNYTGASITYAIVPAFVIG